MDNAELQDEIVRLIELLGVKADIRPFAGGYTLFVWNGNSKVEHSMNKRELLNIVALLSAIETVNNA